MDMKSVRITANSEKDVSHLRVKVSAEPDKHGVVGFLRNLSAGMYEKDLFPIYRKKTCRGYEYLCPLS